MTFTAGQKISTATLDTIGSTALQMLGATQTAVTQTYGPGTAAAADISGATLTFSTQYANTKVAIWAVFDVGSNSTVTTAWGIFVGTCLVDGVAPDGSESHATGVRGTVMQMWIATLGAAGNHTIKLQGAHSGGTDTATTYQTHTKWHALVFGP
jgi:hypothetical protein